MATNGRCRLAEGSGSECSRLICASNQCFVPSRPEAQSLFCRSVCYLLQVGSPIVFASLGSSLQLLHSKPCLLSPHPPLSCTMSSSNVVAVVAGVRGEGTFWCLNRWSSLRPQCKKRIQARYVLENLPYTVTVANCSLLCVGSPDFQHFLLFLFLSLSPLLL